jgi:hypothetical protein
MVAMIKQGLKLKKIITGGQTGADMGGLFAGKTLKVKTGGTAADGYTTERGKNYRLRDIYGLNDFGVSHNRRTMMNVMDSTGTVIFADNLESVGTKLTIALCKKLGKIYLINPTPEELFVWTRDNDIEILNVAGNRESVAPGIAKRTEDIVVKAFRDEKYEHPSGSDD